MQREKFYNLHKTAFLVVALCVVKVVQIGSDQILTMRK